MGDYDVKPWGKSACTKENRLKVNQFLPTSHSNTTFLVNPNNMIKSKCFLPILILYIMTLTSATAPCKLRVYLARAEQTDENGRKCWDTVKVPACGGRCDSREISDWAFPFKKSHHPVCVYGGRRPLMVRLRHCDPGVIAGTDIFHYIAAEDCRCKVCSSEYTSCEWLPPNSTVLDGIYDFEDFDEV